MGREEEIVEDQAGNSGQVTIQLTTYSPCMQLYKTFFFSFKNRKLYVAFVDFKIKKAFDSVNRNALWAVLRKEDVEGKLQSSKRYL